MLAIKYLEKFRDNRNAATLAYFGLLALVSSLFLPIIRTNQLGQMVERSLPSGIRVLFEGGEIFLGLIMVVFSILFPFSKLLLLLVVTTTVISLSAGRRQGCLDLVHKTAKYSNLEIFVVAVLIMFIKVKGLLDIQAGWGLYLFSLALIFSWLGSTCADFPKLGSR